MKFKSLLLALLTLLSLCSCTSGGDDEDNGGGSDNGNSALSRNACGAIGLGTRIITGTECSENNSPVVEISLVLRDGRLGTCTGTMISNQHVLTAAHCFFEPVSQVTISAAGISVTGSQVFVHPDVRVSESDKAVFHDIAIVQLSNPVTLPTLPIVGSRSAVSGEVIDIYGYGQSEDQSQSNDTFGTLRSGQMRVSSVSSDFVDAFYSGEGSNTCSGDSGGPALIDVNGQLGISAVLSSGDLINCEQGDTSRFSNVHLSSNLSFILARVPNARII